MPDIDIDFADRDVVLDKINHRIARLNKDKKHNTGVYVTEIPHNPVDNMSTLDYEEADDRGYFKLDFLNVSLYRDIKSEEQLNRLLGTEPLWDLLTHQEFSDKLFHVGEHSSLLQRLKPTTIEQLAATLAIIRPAKRHLVGKSWTDIMKEVWVKPSDGAYYFKKAHAVAYAHAIDVHMNLICEGLKNENN